MAVIPKPQFPNVRNQPGVPQLARSNLFPPSPGPIIGGVLAAGSLARLFQSIFGEPQWGIYRALPKGDENEVTVAPNRVPVVKPDSFLEFSYRNEYNVADFPMEDGAFASYDKVANPNEITVRMAKGGSKEERKKFLDSIDAIQGDLLLYDIVTPEKTYLDVNVIRCEISRRGAGGAFFLTEVDLYFREIRTVKSQFSSTTVVVANAKSPSASPVVNNGVVQARRVLGPL